MEPQNLTHIKIKASKIRPDIHWETVTTVSGGCIHQCFVLESHDKADRWFLKTGPVSTWPLLKAESEGLQILCSANTDLSVPQPLVCDKTDQAAFLLMDYLPLDENPTQTARTALGQGLHQLHARLSANGCFGFDHDNFIGRTPQVNTWEKDWATFFARHRLTVQLKMARDLGHREIHTRGMRLVERLPAYFADHFPRPSLLHGDLWPGNAGYPSQNTAAVFDPAVYYGDREADLAMMRLFGGFPKAVFSAYRQAAQAAGQPLPAESDMGFQRRIRIYQLYHWLNHLNLFGAGYLPAVRHCLDEIQSL